MNPMRCIRKQSVGFISTLLLLALSPGSVLAAEWDTCLLYNDVATIQCLEPLFENTVIGIAGLAGVALFIMIIAGGYQYLLSGGDQKKLQTARMTLTYAILGLFIMASAFLILRFISVFTGLPAILNFDVPDST